MDLPAHDIGVAATRFQRAVAGAAGKALAGTGLTPFEYGVLGHVQYHEGVSNADLARDLFVTPQALGRITKTTDRTRTRAQHLGGPSPTD